MDYSNSEEFERRGEWGCHIRLQVHCGSQLARLALACVEHFRHKYPNLSQHVQLLSPPGGLHISLSKLFVLRKHQVNPFLDKLTPGLRALPSPNLYLYGDYQVLYSANGRVGYVCLRAEHRGEAMHALVSACDVVLKDFSQVALTLTRTLTRTLTLTVKLNRTLTLTLTPTLTFPPTTRHRHICTFTMYAAPILYRPHLAHLGCMLSSWH